MSENQNASELYGVLAEYETPGDLLAASKQVRDSGFTDWDTHTPFPVHGIDGAMGTKPTKLPYIVLAMGLTGMSGALLLQWWTNAVDYKFLISGKPFFSLPANIPVTFELTVLLSAFGAFVGMLLLNGLPAWYNPLFDVPRFKRATCDRFFVFLSAKDPKFSLERARSILGETKALAVEEVMHDPAPAKVPRGLVYAGIFLASVATIPLAYMVRARTNKSEHPQYHFIPQMDWQAKFKSQTNNPLFADGRSQRRPEAHVIPAGTVLGDDAFNSGKNEDGTWVNAFPSRFDVNETAMAHGRERFEIYCAPCHGVAGYGNGMVAQRAESLDQGTWVPPTSLHAPQLRTQDVGMTFNTITWGIRNMPGYGAQIDVSDRWAIVLYVKALQRSRFAALEDAPESEKAALRP